MLFCLIVNRFSGATKKRNQEDNFPSAIYCQLEKAAAPTTINNFKETTRGLVNRKDVQK